MRANAIGSRFVVGFRLRRRLSSLSQPVVVFLNGEGGREQALKRLFVECQIWPVRWHGIRRGEGQSKLTPL